VKLQERRVDLTNEKRSLKTKPSKCPSTSSKSDEKSADPFRVINWCWIKSLDPLCVLLFMAKLAKGESKFGFCECSICNQGYREILAASKKINGKKILTATSPEIIQEALNTDITKFQINLSTIMGNSDSNNESYDYTSKKGGKNNIRDDKILIEIDKTIIENAIISVLVSDSGKKIISESVKSIKKSSRKDIQK